MAKSNKPTSILITRNAYSWQYGGAEQFTYNLAETLKQYDIEPTIATRVPELIRHSRSSSIKIFKNLWLKNENHRSRLPLYYILFPVLIVQYLYVILHESIDLLLLGSRDDQMFATIAGKILHKPVVWIDHADMKYNLSQSYLSLHKTYLGSMAKADSIIAVSNAELNQIRINLPPKLHSKFVVINNGAVKKVGIPLDHNKTEKIVIYTGRIEKDKGVFDLVQAAKKILARNTGIVFWIVGKGTSEIELKNLIKTLGLTKNFRFFGYLDNIGSALNAADVFIYPSHHDASPLAPIEALLAGLPVVATKVGGIPEVIDPTCGILVEPNRPEELSRALERILFDVRLLKRLKVGAINRGEQFELSRVVKDHYIPLFERLWSDK